MAARKKDESLPVEGPPILRLESIVGNDRARRLLSRALREERLFPSLLFTGPRGVGKLTTARALAATLNCADPDDVQACERCASCRKIAAWHHPDVKVLESETGAEEAGRPLFFRTTAPDASRSASTSRSGDRLLIAQVRNLVREVGFRPFEGRRRVIIIRDLETDPSQGCANVLLKTLEEPPADTVFVVVSARPERLPATVHSRCHGLPFVPVPRAEVETFLRQRGAEPDEARWRAAWSGGRPGAALRLDAAGRLARRDALLEALAAAGEGPAAALAAAEPFARRGNDLREALDDLALIVRDVMIWPHDTQREMLTNRDRQTEVEALARRIPPARAGRLLEQIAWSSRAIERHVNGSLILQTLMLEAGGHLPAGPFTDPWRTDVGRGEPEA